MAWRAKIGRHVHYITPSGRMRSGRVTAVTDQDNVNVKVYGGATLGVKTRHSSVSANGTRANKFRRTA